MANEEQVGWYIMELNTGDKKLSPTDADMSFQSHNFKPSNSGQF